MSTGHAPGTSGFSPERRALLRGRAREPEPLRPPWALPEAAFLSACNGCLECIKACPEQVLAQGSGGYPVFDPARGECLFCEECVKTCKPGALDLAAAAAPWSLQATIGATCLAKNSVTCFSCRDACGEDAIQFRPARGGAVPELDPDRCTGCGACVNPCPVSAIVLSAMEPGDG